MAVIDVTDGKVQPDMTVVISGGRVTAVGKAGAVRAPKDVQVVDAGGKFLIPGLWDMHAHRFMGNAMSDNSND